MKRLSTSLALAAAAAMMVGPGLTIPPYSEAFRDRMPAIPVQEEPKIVGYKIKRRDTKKRFTGRLPKEFRAWHGRNCAAMVRRGVPHFLAYGLPPGSDA